RLVTTSSHHKRRRMNQRRSERLVNLRPQHVVIPQLPRPQRFKITVRPLKPLKGGTPLQQVHALSGPPQDQPQVVILRRNRTRDHVTHEPVRVVILLTKYVPGRLSVQTLQQPINEIVLVRPNLGNSNLVRHVTTALRPPLLERPEPPPRLRLLVVANQCANATDSTGNTSPSGR